MNNHDKLMSVLHDRRLRGDPKPDMIVVSNAVAQDLWDEVEQWEHSRYSSHPKTFTFRGIRVEVRPLSEVAATVKALTDAGLVAIFVRGNGPMPPLDTPEPVSDKPKGEIPRHEPIRFIGGTLDGKVMRCEATPKRTFPAWDDPSQVYILGNIRSYCMDHLFYYHESLHQVEAIERLLLGDYDGS